MTTEPIEWIAFVLSVAGFIAIIVAAIHSGRDK